MAGHVRAAGRGPAADDNELKAPAIRGILERVFRAHALLPAVRGELGAPS